MEGSVRVFGEEKGGMLSLALSFFSFAIEVDAQLGRGGCDRAHSTCIIWCYMVWNGMLCVGCLGLFSWGSLVLFLSCVVLYQVVVMSPCGLVASLHFPWLVLLSLSIHKNNIRNFMIFSILARIVFLL